MEQMNNIGLKKKRCPCSYGCTCATSLYGGGQLCNCSNLELFHKGQEPCNCPNMVFHKIEELCNCSTMMFHGIGEPCNIVYDRNGYPSYIICYKTGKLDVYNPRPGEA